MVDPGTTQRWFYHLLFTGLALMILILQLAPFGGGPQTVPGPDILICLVLVWIQRRPDYLPLFLLAAILLTADFLLMRPPGLWAGLTLVGAEFLRRLTHGARELPFFSEWGYVAGVVIAITLSHWLINTLVAAPPVSLVMGLAQALATIIVYPLVLILSQTAFNIRRRPLDGQSVGGA